MRAFRLRSVLSPALAACLALGACRPAPPDVAGSWRAVLTSPGGELPFGLRIERGAGGLSAVVLNGSEEAPTSGVDEQDGEVVIRFDGYDSKIVARLDGSGALSGRWEKRQAKDVARMPFRAERAQAETSRFVALSRSGLEPGAATVPSVAGPWAVAFTDEDGVSPARAELEQDGARVTGTFLTPTGDHRYLEGSYESGVLRLSAFDGAHAFLYRARAAQDGTLTGDFWSRDAYHAGWTARRAEAGETVLPDAWQEIGLTNGEGRFRFRFPDLTGRSVGLDDPGFAGKVVLVNLFGSWCPNCNDEAPFLADLDRRYRDRGLAIVGLAFEVTGDAERDREFVRRFGERHGIGYPLLLAGTSDKKAASASLPDLTRVAAFPTTIFLGRDGKVRKIHSGFEGPGTGARFPALKREFEAVVEGLLADAGR